MPGGLPPLSSFAGRSAASEVVCRGLPPLRWSATSELVCRWSATSELVCHSRGGLPPLRSFAIPRLRHKCFYHIKNTRPRKDGCNITHSLYHLFTRLYYCIPTYALSITGKTRQGLLRTFSLQLGSDFHCSTTRTGLTPSPVRCAFCQNSYCLRQRFYAL